MIPMSRNDVRVGPDRGSTARSCGIAGRVYRASSAGRRPAASGRPASGAGRTPSGSSRRRSAASPWTSASAWVSPVSEVSRTSSSIFSVATPVQPWSSWRFAIARWTLGSPGAIARRFRQCRAPHRDDRRRGGRDRREHQVARRGRVACFEARGRSAASVSGSGGGPTMGGGGGEGRSICRPRLARGPPSARGAGDLRVRLPARSGATGGARRLRSIPAGSGGGARIGRPHRAAGRCAGAAVRRRRLEAAEQRLAAQGSPRA